MSQLEAHAAAARCSPAAHHLQVNVDLERLRQLPQALRLARATGIWAVLDEATWHEACQAAALIGGRLGIGRDHVVSVYVGPQLAYHGLGLPSGRLCIAAGAAAHKSQTPRTHASSQGRTGRARLTLT